MLAWFESLFSGCFASLIAWALLACSTCLPAWLLLLFLLMHAQPATWYSLMPPWLTACLPSYARLLLFACFLLAQPCHCLAACLLFHSFCLASSYACSASHIILSHSWLPASHSTSCLPVATKKQEAAKKGMKKARRKEQFWLLLADLAASFSCFLLTCLPCLASHHVILPQ